MIDISKSEDEQKQIKKKENLMAKGSDRIDVCQNPFFLIDTVSVKDKSRTTIEDAHLISSMVPY